MARYIDADAMLETLKRKYPQWYTGKPKDSWMHYAWLVYHQAVENAPTVDAVPVVRCKDCKHHRYCCRGSIPMDDNGFCSAGERKEDD